MGNYPPNNYPPVNGFELMRLRDPGFQLGRKSACRCPREPKGPLNEGIYLRGSFKGSIRDLEGLGFREFQ